MFDKLAGAPRLLLQQELRPAQGERFQPTGFADLGAAVFETPEGKRMLLVESAQSVANRMEATCLKGSGPDIAPELDGLPYVRVKLTGPVETWTSSLVEAHRINSPFIISQEAFKKAFIERSGYAKGKPLDWRKIARAVFYYDVNTLLHGVFMANLEDGRVKLPRAVTGFIEASDVREAASGGVKNNPLDPTGKLRAEGYDENVYGNVPYARMEYTAKETKAYFNLDLALLEGYALEPEAKELLVALALYKIRRFLSTGLRLRTACDFEPSGAIQVQKPEGFEVPTEAALLEQVRKSIGDCRAKGLFAEPPVTDLTTKCVLKVEKEKGEKAAAGA
jgi:CRISPR-associated protein Csb1